MEKTMLKEVFGRECCVCEIVLEDAFKVVLVFVLERCE